MSFKDFTLLFETPQCKSRFALHLRRWFLAVTAQLGFWSNRAADAAAYGSVIRRLYIRPAETFVIETT